MRVFKTILIVLLIGFIIIQFFRPEKNKTDKPQANNIANVYSIPPDVNKTLKSACNDCHSNNTDYPWYNNIQPVAWWLNGHIKDGKRHLNFDEFLSYSLRKQYNKMEECMELVKEEEMPLESYTWIHKDADLTDAQRTSFIDWVETVRHTMEAKYPVDSLVRKN